ncbi:uncharacterized protein LOC107371824 isoform X2 [Tetranychus urticae]|uniref:uncharacterized protein LOC107371824 isoform X2 n=1 Tax=Tetranychus urticae TaxID=32264 RepID=UPI00077BBD94|nr:uncharacterized protein LOC107371824 isoform X2 [Tetranychus urticae]
MGCGSSASYRRNDQMSRPDTKNLRTNGNNTKSIEITKEALQSYLDLEHAIRDQEKKHILETYQIKTEQLDQLEEALVQMEELLAQCQDEASSFSKKLGNGDLHTTREFILRKSYTDQKLSGDEENFLDVLNKQELVERDYKNTLSQIEELKTDIARLSKEGEKLQKLYASRDELLDTIFEGQYGSDLENQLERELDWLLEQKRHVDQAYFRWRQAQIQVKQACALLSESVQKWKDVLSIPIEENETRYEMVAEVRNKLSEASSDLQSAQRYLPNITFPYCSPDEIATLDKAISYIFTDMQTRERHEHALFCYQTTYKRAASLKQWLEHVLTSTISRDLFEITEDCKARASELRNERTRLIRQRIKEITGNDLDYDGKGSHELRDSGVDSEFDDTSTADEQIARIFESSRSERKGAKSLTPDPTRVPFVMPTPLPSADLAPTPQKEEIFGRIESLRNRYKKEIMDLERNQKLNQARVTQGLKEKLQARRSRRSRLQMHNRELEALRETP